MYMLDSKWPTIEKVVGVDLSTYKLAVCEEKKTLMVRNIAEQDFFLTRCG